MMRLDDVADFGSTQLFFLPAIHAFGERPVHKFTRKTASGWDWTKVFNEQKLAIVRESTSLSDAGSDRYSILLEWPETVFLHLNRNKLTVLSPDYELSQKVAAEFLDAYSIKTQPVGATYNLITNEIGFSTTRVELDANQIPRAEDLDMIYGEGFELWLQFLISKLSKRSGLTLLQGSSGTGKTTLLRHLIVRLQATHRFYFISPSSASAIAEPDFAYFWKDQHEEHGEKQFVCVFEDAEAALMRRGEDNRSKVEAILNMTDGLLADFLKLQIICTVNCEVSELDPAILRPGRLIGHRRFSRLPTAQAQRIADKLQRQLPDGQEDYSLAEIFNDDSRPKIKLQSGFGFM